MKYNFTTKNIEITNAEAKAIGKVGTKAFNEYQALHTAFPNAEIQLPQKKAKKTGLKIDSLTYEVMEQIIATSKSGDEKAMLLKQFRNYRDGKVEISKDLILNTKKKSYGFIRKWFITNFPELRADNNTESEETAAAVA